VLVLEGRYGGDTPAGEPIITSGKIHTHGNHLIKYGKIEISMRFPTGQGIWPSIFMLPAYENYGGWPASGEIDIMESVNAVNRMHGTIHFGEPANSNGIKAQNGGFLKRGYRYGGDGRFHTLELLWTPRAISWYVDGLKYLTVTKWFTEASNNPVAPFDDYFELILNLAIGRDWPEWQQKGVAIELISFVTQMHHSLLQEGNGFSGGRRSRHDDASSSLHPTMVSKWMTITHEQLAHLSIWIMVDSEQLVRLLHKLYLSRRRRQTAVSLTPPLGTIPITLYFAPNFYVLLGSTRRGYLEQLLPRCPHR
jgi:beta-glucanase (GH16 family)